MKFPLHQKTAGAIPYLLLVIMPFIIFWPLWLHAQAMAYDMADYFLPYRYFIGECLQQHQFPWWNPYTGMGVPMAADPQSGVFYPVTWLTGYFAGYDFLIINIEYLLHLVIAGCGMYLLLRGSKYTVMICLWLSWSYQFCGFFVNNAQHYSWIISAAWLPYIFHYYRRLVLYGHFSDCVKMSLSLFLFTTGGYPAFLIILGYLLGGHFLYEIARNFFRKKSKAVSHLLRWSGTTLAVYLALAAPYIFSFLQGIPLMTRGEALVRGHASFSAFTPQSLVTFFLPAVPLGQNGVFQTDTSMTNIYIGLTALLFFLLGIVYLRQKAVRAGIIMAFLFLLIAFGDALPLWPLLFDTVPFFDHIRFPAAFRLFAIIGCLLSAAAVMMTEQSTRSKKLRIVIVTFILVLLLLCTVAVYYNTNFFAPRTFSTAGLLKFFGESSAVNNMVWQSILQLILLLALLAVFFSKQQWQSRNWYSMVTLLLLLDLFIASRINFTTIMSSPFASGELNKKLSATPAGLPFWDAMSATETTNIGDGSFAPAYFNNNLFRKQFSRDAYSPFVLKLKRDLDHSPVSEELMDRPVIYISGTLQQVPPNSSDSVRLINRHAVLVNDAVLRQLPPFTADSLAYDIRLTSFSANRLMANVHTDRMALLVLQQTFYPGWKVMVDNKPANVLIANFSMMSVLLPAGSHRVEFRFDTTFTQWLLLISTSLLLLSLLFVFLYSVKIIGVNALNSPRE